MNIRLIWSQLKNQIVSNGVIYKYSENTDEYVIYVVDGPFQYDCIILKNGNNEHIDFETNFKAGASKNISQFDIDGAGIVRIKAAKKGWSFWACPPEITTSTLGGTLYCKDVSGTDIPGVSCKIYNENGTEITTAGLSNSNLAFCVKTVLDIEFPFDIELIGGTIRVHSNPVSDLKLWVVGAPDIPAIYGGSKEFASGINLKFLAPDNAFDIDGVVTKYLTYNAVTHTGKIRLIFKHPQGLTVNLQAVIRLYRL